MIDSSANPTIEEAMDVILRNHSASLRVMLPGVIESYDPDRQCANVKPLLPIPRDTGLETFEEEIDVLPCVPVVFPRAGDFFLSLPLKEGNYVMLVFGDRSFDRWWRGNGSKVDEPILQHTHHESDAVALAGFYPDQDALADAHPDNLVLGKNGGAQIHVKDDEVNIYEENAADFVALAQKVLDELDAISSAFSNHTHDVVFGACTAGGTTGTAPSGPAASYTPSSVAAEKVKAT